VPYAQRGGGGGATSCSWEHGRVWDEGLEHHTGEVFGSAPVSSFHDVRIGGLDPARKKDDREYALVKDAESQDFRHLKGLEFLITLGIRKKMR
jgi:hypothetical protein